LFTKSFVSYDFGYVITFISGIAKRSNLPRQLSMEIFEQVVTPVPHGIELPQVQLFTFISRST